MFQGSGLRKKPAAAQGYLWVRLLLGAALTYYAVSFLRRNLRQSDAVRLQPLTSEKLPCPPAQVDWRGFVDPGPMFTGSAAIFASDFTDTSILWLIYALQGLGYTVSIYAEPQHAPAAKAFLTRAATLNVAHPANVQVQVVTVDTRGELQGNNVAMFIYICHDALPTVSGLGTGNIVIMQPTGPVPDAAGRAALIEAADPQHLATYDFLLYRTSATYSQRLPVILPVLERLQEQDMLFPLVDIVSLPAAPAHAATAEMGVTFSMSRYDNDRRRLLVHALSEFNRLHQASPSPVRLIVCSWLLPGIAEDLPFLKQQVASLNLNDVYEYRDEVDLSTESYEGIAVQWHLYNPEEKPHFVATAAMPAGVWVLDCTGTVVQLKGVLYGDCASITELHASTLRFLRQPDSTRSSRGRQIISKSSEAVGGLIRFRMLYLVHRSFTSKIIRFFMRSTQAAYRARLQPGVHGARARKASQLQVAGKPRARNAAVIVEARPHYGFLYVVLNAAWYLPGWDLHVVHSSMNAGYVKRILSPHVDVTYHQLPSANVDIDGYNLLMKNASFWQMFNADHILLYQTDSIILRYGVEQFTKYDYVGAPWHQDNERWSLPEMRAALPEGVGNGGFSMRSTKAMVEICNAHSARSPIKEQEDVFFAIHIQNHPTLLLPDRKSAYRFCMEVPCSDLPEAQPLALHAAWFYTPIPNMQKLLDTSLLGLLDCDLSNQA